MPYIPLRERQWIDPHVDELAKAIDGPGQLNYAITKLMLGVLARRPQSYAAFNEAIGVLECAKAELYRVQISPYEDAKKVAHGAVRP